MQKPLLQLCFQCTPPVTCCSLQPYIAHFCQFVAEFGMLLSSKTVPTMQLQGSALIVRNGCTYPADLSLREEGYDMAHTGNGRASTTSVLDECAAHPAKKTPNAKSVLTHERWLLRAVLLPSNAMLLHTHHKCKHALDAAHTPAYY